MIHTTTRAPRARHSVRHHLVAVLALVAGLALLMRSGTSLPGPPSDPAAWFDWWATTDPALAVGALLRLLAVGSSSYLLLLTSLDLVGLAIGLRPLSRLARRLAPAAWRAVVLRPIAAGTLAVPTLFVPALTAAPAIAQEADVADSPATDQPITLTMTWGGGPTDEPTADGDPTSTASTTTTAPPVAVDVDPTTGTADAPVEAPGAVAPPTLALTPMPSPADAPAEAPAVSWPEETADHLDDPGGPPVPPTHTAPEDTAPSGTPRVHVVRPGDSFWRIAEEHVTTDLGRSPSPHETRLYWRALIAANADRLPVPGDPDVIFPGAELRLPDLGGPS